MHTDWHPDKNLVQTLDKASHKSSHNASDKNKLIEGLYHSQLILAFLMKYTHTELMKLMSLTFAKNAHAK